MDSIQLFDVSAALGTLGHRHGDALFQGDWADIHWMSTPGPMYCGATDNCGTGPVAAPNNVTTDEDGFEVLYRQPATLDELHEVVQAAECDTFAGYGANGDVHWSYEMLKVWWTEPRCKIEQEVRRLYEFHRANGTYVTWVNQLHQWLDYYQHGLYHYLQAYAFFLDTRRLPQPNDRLPDL